MRHVQLKHGIAAVSKDIKPETLDALDEMMKAAGKQMKTDIRERPILFSGPMVIAILTCKQCGHISERFPCEKCNSEDFVKTKTRRVTKTQPSEPLYLQKLYGKSPDGFAFGDRGLWTVAGPDYPDGDSDQFRCPYGAEKDRLWVRETWAARPAWDDVKPSEIPEGYAIYYRATQDVAVTLWRPSIFMPRWASRITLEIVSIEAERLQEISAADIEAEGITLPPTELYPQINRDYKLRQQWQWGWDKINGKRKGCAWASNPWVFVISFRRIQPK